MALKTSCALSLVFTCLLVCGTVMASSATAEAKQHRRNGLNYLNGQWSGPKYNSSVAFSTLAAMQTGTGANWIAMTYCYFQKDVDSTGPIYPRSSSPTQEELSSMVHHAHSALNMSVFFRPCIDPDWSNPATHGTWRGEIGRYFSAADWDTWFGYYLPYIVKQAALAQELKVDMFSVGMEYVTASFQSAHWRKVVAAVRKVYSYGPITYCANHGNEAIGVNWWDTVDEISVDAYYSLALGVKGNNPSIPQLVEAWSPIVLELSELSSIYGNKSINFAEIGYCSCNGGNNNPANTCGANYGLNLTAQVNLYTAFFEAVYTQPWFKGVFWWAWLTDPTNGGTADAGFTPNGKPAEKVLKKYFG